MEIDRTGFVGDVPKVECTFETFGEGILILLLLLLLLLDGKMGDI